jgi:Na+-driven multidrug efflux pump
MKKITYKLLLIIPFVLFVDWILMIITGCFAGACHAGEDFYCKFYCIFGIILLVSTITGSVYIAFHKKRKLNDNLT